MMGYKFFFKLEHRMEFIDLRAVEEKHINNIEKKSDFIWTLKLSYT